MHVGKLENLNDKVKKMIYTVEEKCEICKRNGCSKSKPSVAVVAVDLNVVGTGIYYG